MFARHIILEFRLEKERSCPISSVFWFCLRQIISTLMMLLHKSKSALRNSIKAIGYFTRPLTVMDWLSKYEQATESYDDAKLRWPTRKTNPPGKWILASFDDESIIVYQAYNSEIAQYACNNHRFMGCPGYNEKRMTCKQTFSLNFKRENEVLLQGSKQIFSG